MLHLQAPVTLTMSRGELRAWHQGPVRLRVVSGRAWVTRPNDPHDHFLHAGDMLTLADGLIEADEPLCLRLEHPPLPARGMSQGIHAARAAWQLLVGVRRLFTRSQPCTSSSSPSRPLAAAPR